MKGHFVAALLGLMVATASLLGIHSAAHAQTGGPTVTFTAIPKNLQLYPRDLTTNRAAVPIAGSVDSPDQDEIIVRIYREDVLHGTLSQPLTYEGGSASFSFAPEITAELASYDFEIFVRDGDTESLVAEVESVVAGDVYLINGQSNAFANKRSGSPLEGSANGNQHEFLRSFGRREDREDQVALLTADTEWHLAEGDGSWGPGYVGQWGLRLGRLILDAYQVPVAILNGAHGGKGITWFIRNDTDPGDLSTNYGRLLWRAQEAGVTQGVRAIFWYQGEGDGGRPATHENGFISLVEDWHTDFPALEKVYVMQIRNSTCTVPISQLIDLMDRQRRLDSLDTVEVMSTTGLDGHDGCHFYYTEGYEKLAQHLFGIVRRDLYGEANLQNVDAPHISSALLRSPTEIELVMRDPDDTLIFEEGAEADFVIQGPPVPVTVTSGIAEGNKIRLLLSGDASQATHISYVGHPFAGPWVTNANGVGMLAFRVPLSTTPNGPPNGPPTVSITVPDEGATFTQGEAIQIQAEANDPDGPVVKVEFYSTATLIGTATAAPWQISWSDAPVGSHTITAVATDSDGDTATSEPVNIVVEAQPGNSAPSVSITSPTSGDTFSVGESILIQATASDSNGSVSKVEFFADGQLLGADNTAPYQFVWNTAPGGDHSLTAIATDNQGATAISTPVNIHVAEETAGTVRLGVEPSISHVAPGERFSVTVAVRATDQQLDGVAAYLDFDPAALQVVEIIMGNTLPTVLQNQHDNFAGTIDIAAGIELGTQNYATGNFPLATIVFDAVSAPTVAESALTFATAVPRKSDATFEGASHLSDIQNGAILFEIAEVSGQVLLERETGVQDPPHPSWQVPLTVKLFRADEGTAAEVDVSSTPAYVYTPTTDETGAFTLGGIVPGSYVAAIKNSHTLQTVQTVNLIAGDNSIIFETLREGDADNNNFVGLVDFSVVASAFGQCTGAAEFDARADFTQDGCVNLTDFSLFSGNYGEAGDMAPGDSASSSGAMSQNGAVILSLIPSSATASTGQPFDVAVQVQAGDQTIDVAGIFLNYDPAVLRLESVTPGAAFDTVLRNIFDNSAGTFNYEAGKLGGPFPNGTFTVVTLRFTPRQAAAATSLAFSQEVQRQTSVYRSGINRLQSADTLVITVGEEETPEDGDRSVFLPLVP